MKTDSALEKEEKKKLIDSLVTQIQHHQDLYYNNNPVLSDDEFDALWDKLRSLDAENNLFKNIGTDDGFFQKKQHIMPMGSLDKASDNNEFIVWAEKHKSEHYVVQYKLDGASLELQYNKGKLEAAVTRGNGSVGDNILINARNMQGVVKSLPVDISCAIRGEVIMTHKVHKEHFSDMANCRNAANGLMKKKDGKGVNLLTVLCYDIWFANQEMEDRALKYVRAHKKNTSDTQFFSEEEKLSFLKLLKCSVVPYTICKTADNVISHRDATIKKRDSLSYDIDGLVIKMPYAEKEDMMSLRPDRQIAFKFPLETVVSTIQGIEWSESGHLYTPVALLAPVHIAGTIVKRASLVNPKHMQELGIKIGAEVLVTKRGEIIPKVEKVVYTPENAEDVLVPEKCGTCNAVVVNEGTKLYCSNIRCRRRLLFRVQRWITMLEIDYWGEALLQRLIMKEKLINKIGDIYRISTEQLMELDRIGEPLAKKLYRSLHSIESISFEKFIASIGIENVARITGEKIADAGIADWNTLLHAKLEELSAVDGVGDTIARAIIDGITLLKEELDDLLNFISIEKRIIKTGKFSGQSFCFTGTLVYNGETLARKDLQEMVRKSGGSIKTSITKDLTYLVSANKNSTSSKTKKALEYGVSVIDAKEFFEKLQ